MQMKPRWLTVLLLLVLTAISAEGVAQVRDRAMNARTFSPAVDKYGLFTVDGAKLPAKGEWQFKLTSHFSRRPIGFEFSTLNEGSLTPAVDYALVVHLQSTVAVTSFMSIFLDIPFSRQWLGQPFERAESGGFVANDPASIMNRWPQTVTASDSLLGFKFRIWGIRGFTFGAKATLGVPFGDEGTFNGESRFTGHGALLAEYRTKSFFAGIDIGYLNRKKTLVLDPVSKDVLLEVNDELTWGVGASYWFIDSIGLGIEATGVVPLLASADTRTGDSARDLPMEALGGVLFRIRHNVSGFVGGSMGFSRFTPPGEYGRGVEWRAFAGLGFALRKEKVEKIEEEVEVDVIPDEEVEYFYEPVVVEEEIEEEKVEEEEEEDIAEYEDWETEHIEPVPTEKIEVEEQIMFVSGKAVITEESKRILDKVAETLNRHTHIQLVRIEGHTDSIGQAKRNLKLSQERADEVLRYLVAKGVNPKRLQAVGYGQTRPIDTNKTAEGRARNRRVEFIIVR